MKVLSKFVCFVMVFVIFVSMLSIPTNATQSCSQNFNKSYLTSGSVEDVMLSIAQAQVGKTQSDLGYTEAWCADFVCDCAKLAGQSAVIPFYGACDGLKTRVLNAGGSIVSSRKKGDLVFYFCSSCNKNVHVGLVLDATYSIEGNYSNKVTKVGSSYTDAAGHTLKSGTISRTYVRPAYSGSTLSTPDLVFWWISKPDNTDTGIDVSGTPTLNGSYKFWFKKYLEDTNYFVNIYLDDKLLLDHGGVDSGGYISQIIDTATLGNGTHTVKADLYHTNGMYSVKKDFIVDNLIRFHGFTNSDNSTLGIDPYTTPSLKNNIKFWFKDINQDGNYYINIYLDGNLIEDHIGHDSSGYSSTIINMNTISNGYHEIKAVLVHTNGASSVTKGFYSTITKCTVTFNPNGGSCSTSSKIITYSLPYGALPTPTRTGYIFNGWYTAASGGNKVTSSTTVTNASDHPLYAQWSQIVLSSISVKTNPSDVSYCVGETLNTSGLTLTAKYSDGSTKTISSGFTCSPTTLNTVGTQKITVTYSGKTTSFNVIVNAHSQKTTTTNATCEVAGKTVVICTVCGKKISETTIPAKGHTVVTDKAVAATCETAGKTEGSHCTVCNKVIKAQTTVPAKGHTTVIDKAVAATCETAGKTEGSHCSVCNKVLKAQTTVPAKGHTTVIDKAVAATCETAGKTEGSHCSVCNKVLKAQTTVPAKGHTTVIDKAVAATCEAAGKTEGSHCYVCNKVLKAQTTVPAKGHTTVIDKAVAATCETAGKTEGSHCSVCNKVLKAQTTVPAKGHTTVIDKAVAATCETAGKTEGSHCSVCNKVLVAQTTVPAKGHTTVIDKAVAATCETEGKTEGSHCSVCTKVIKAQTTVPAKGHTTVIDKAVAATCETAGKTEGSHCSVCNKVLKAQTIIPAKGHTVVTDKAVSATCETAGKTEGSHCSVCGKVLVAQTTVPEKGHSYSSVVTPPTATEQGYTTYTCSICGDKYISDYVPAIGGESFNCKGTVVSSSSTDNSVKIEFIPEGAVKPAYTKSVNGTDVEFTLNDVISGNYTIRVSKEDHVTREYSVTVNSDTDVALKLHLVGDLNGDGKVNTMDVARANASAKGTSSLSGYEFACADINGDGKVNTMDVARMNAHAKSVSTLW